MSTEPRAGIVAIILLSLGACSLCSFAGPVYTVTNIGTLGGPSSSANDINNLGQVVGGSVTAEGDSRGFLYHNGTLTNLGTPPGLGATNARSINDAGDIAVNATSSDNQSVQRAFIYPNGVYQDLGTLSGGSEINATSIANGGFVTGNGNAAGSDRRAFLHVGGSTITLGTLGGDRSVGQGVNSLGHVVGYAETATGANHAFLYTGGAGGAGGAGALQDLGTLGGTVSQANAINDHGGIAGQSAVNSQGATRAFRYQDGNMIDLGTLGDGSSFANDINNAGDVVGYVQANSGPSPFVAFISGSDGITDLNTLIPADSGWSLWFAAAINDNGQIVGSGTFKGEPRAFLLTPGTSGPDPMVPLPPAAIPGAALLTFLAVRYLLCRSVPSCN